MFQKLKPYMMPTALALGAIFHPFFGQFAYLTPYLIFAMLFLTYSNMHLKEIKPRRLHLWLILVQILGSISLYLLLLPVNKVLAQGAMVCIIAPTASAAAVITGMLKGNVESLTAFSLLSNVATAIFTPLIFSLTGENNTLSFGMGMLTISRSVLSVILIPISVVVFLKIFAPHVTETVAKYSIVSFFIWTFALAVASGRTVSFILKQNSGSLHMEVLLALEALLICAVLFGIGKFIGRKYKDTIAGGQGLGQKNTILAIWMAQTYMNPLSSVAPGIYILWQNIFNSWQIWYYAKKDQKNMLTK